MSSKFTSWYYDYDKLAECVSNVCQFSIHDEQSEIRSVAIQYKIIIVLIIYNIRYDNNYLQTTVHNINNLIMHFGEYTIHCIRTFIYAHTVNIIVHTQVWRMCEV